jgi:hypothetical protein
MIEARWRDTTVPQEQLEDLARNLRSFAAVYPSITLQMDVRSGLNLAGVIEAVLKVREIEAQHMALLLEVQAAEEGAKRRAREATECMARARSDLAQARRRHWLALLYLLAGAALFMGVVLWR